eukprot:SAG11_NODE_16139_length_556_cov_0.680525_1_plen_102_part_00
MVCQPPPSFSLYCRHVNLSDLVATKYWVLEPTQISSATMRPRRAVGSVPFATAAAAAAAAAAATKERPQPGAVERSRKVGSVGRSRRRQRPPRRRRAQRLR